MSRSHILSCHPEPPPFVIPNGRSPEESVADFSLALEMTFSFLSLPSPPHPINVTPAHHTRHPREGGGLAQKNRMPAQRRA